ncbi:DUF2283 domain-containing protein [Streptoalloteichus tenebrarius]|nr:DUF2283 domain-containing protein [Streptoalloteichus tenebrarius]
MRMSHDPEADASYVRLVDQIHPGEAVTQIVVEDDRLPGGVVLDLDADGRLLGIEVLGASRLLRPEVLRRARRGG